MLLGLLPPLLYAAAMQTSLVDFNANRRPILLLSVGLVVFTTVGVGVARPLADPGHLAGRWRSRSAPWSRRPTRSRPRRSAAGSACPAGSSRSSRASRCSTTRPPSSRCARRSPPSAAAVTVLEVGLDFLLAAGGGVAVGLRDLRHGRHAPQAGHRPAAGHRDLAGDAVRGVPRSPRSCTPRGVIAVVVAGLLLGHKAPIIQTAQSRIAERMNWRTIAFLLENTVFLLIGLQAEWIIDGVADSELGGRADRRGLCGVAGRGDRAAAGLGLPGALPPGPARPRPPHRQTPPWQYTFVLGWAGMRGVVTLAAAFVIPEDTEHREVLLLIAFTVVAGTLFIQGLVAARGSPAGSGARRPTRPRTRWPGPRCCTRPRKAGLERARRAEDDDPHGVCDADPQPARPAQLRGLGAAGPHAADQETPSETLRPAAAGDDRRRAREGAGDPQRRHGRPRRGQRGARHARRRGVDARPPPPRRDGDCAAEQDAWRAVGDTCDHLDNAPRRRRRRTPRRVRGLRRDGTSLGPPAHAASPAATSGAATPRRSKHATAHFHDTAHPVMRSAEPGEDWRWCFVHHLTG